MQREAFLSWSTSSLTTKKVNPALFVVSTIIIGFILSSIPVTLAQLDDNFNRDKLAALKSDPNGKYIVLISLTPNETRPDYSLSVSISKQDFWRAFGPFAEQLTSVDGSK